MKTILILALVLISANAAFKKVATCCTDGQYYKVSTTTCTACAAWCKSCDMAVAAQDQDGTKQGAGKCPCKLTGCAACTKDAECDTCGAGYFKVGKLCEPCTAASKCKECETKIGNCKNCNTKFWKDAAVDPKVCKACIANCDTCTTATDCSACTWKAKNFATGDVVTYIKTTAECDTVSIKQCVGEFAVVSKACTAVGAKTVANCLIYHQTGENISAGTYVAKTDTAAVKCQTCKTGYKKSADTCVTSVKETCTAKKKYDAASNTCVAGDVGCKTLNADKIKCDACLDGFYLDTTCKACAAGQKTCSKTACLSAAIGYCAPATGACKAAANSLVCTAAADITSCAGGFKISTDKKTCEACTIANCKDCDADKAKCAVGKCKDGFYNTADTACLACTASKNCAKCTAIDKCTVCPLGRKLDANDNCALIANCKTYVAAKEAKCETCNSGYQVLSTKLECVACAAGYKSCHINCAGISTGTCWNNYLVQNIYNCKCLNSKVLNAKTHLCEAASSGGDASGGGGSSSSASASSSAIFTSFQIALFALISMFLF